jgi:hypothetical protein
MKELSIFTETKVLAEEQYAINLATITCVEHIQRILVYIISDAQEHKLISMNRGNAVDFIADKCTEYAANKTHIYPFIASVMKELTVGRELSTCHDTQKSYLYINIKLTQETERLIVSKC